MKRLTIEVEFDIGEVVYINTDSDQEKYIIMSYVTQPTVTMYGVYNHAYGVYNAFSYELSRDKSII